MPRRFVRFDTDNERPSTSRSFAHQRPLHDLFGGGKVADILLWRNIHLSAAILAGVTLIWFLFEVVEYHFITLICHLSIIAMIVLLLWSSVAPVFDWPLPNIPAVTFSERTFREATLVIHAKLSRFLYEVQDIAFGKNPKLFVLVIFLLWILSAIGSYCSSLTLLYFAFLCAHTLPALYERYEGEMDHLAAKGRNDLKKFYKKFDSKVLEKIPRGPTKERK